MNLLFAINKRFTSLLLECLWSVVQKGGADRYDAYILHSDLSEEDKKNVQDGADPSVICHFIEVPDDLFEGFPTTKRYPHQIYYRLAAPILLPEQLDKILYLDVDTVVINSLVQLYEIDFGEDLFMACTHTGDIMTKMNQVRLGIDKTKEVPYINTGVMMMNLSLLRRTLKLEDIREYVLERQHALVLPDQDILTALYGERVKLLDTMLYNISDRSLILYNADPKHKKRDVDWVRKNSVVIHYYGKNKPWKEGYVGKLDVFYHENKDSMN